MEVMIYEYDYFDLRPTLDNWKFSIEFRDREGDIIWEMVTPMGVAGEVEEYVLKLYLLLLKLLILLSITFGG